MNTLQAQEVAKDFIRDQHMPGGEIGIGYKLYLQSSQVKPKVMVREAYGSHEGIETQHMSMYFSMWARRIAEISGVEFDSEAVAPVETELIKQLEKED